MNSLALNSSAIVEVDMFAVDPDDRLYDGCTASDYDMKEGDTLVLLMKIHLYMKVRSTPIHLIQLTESTDSSFLPSPEHADFIWEDGEFRTIVRPESTKRRLTLSLSLSSPLYPAISRYLSLRLLYNPLAESLR